MKPKIAPIKLGILSITTLCVGLASTAYADDHGSCSLANVAGILGLHLQGDARPSNRRHTAGIGGNFHPGCAGQRSWNSERSVGGTSGLETVTGTIRVNADCTGTLKANVYESGQFVRSAVIPLVYVYDNNRGHLRSIFQSLTPPNGTHLAVVVTIDGMRVSSERHDSRHDRKHSRSRRGQTVLPRPPANS
jgi:hypothetical protein